MSPDRRGPEYVHKTLGTSIINSPLSLPPSLLHSLPASLPYHFYYGQSNGHTYTRPKNENDLIVGFKKIIGQL